MLPFRLPFGARVGALAGLAAFVSLSALAGSRTPARQSLLTAPSRQEAHVAVPRASQEGRVASIAGQIQPASYLSEPHAEYRVTDLGTLAGASFATAINNQGKVVGSCQTPHGDIAFLWKSGHLRRLGSFSAYDINDRGQIVGFKELRGGIEQPLLRSGAQTTLLGTLPGASSAYSYRINNRGQVLENALGGSRMVSHALVWSGQRSWPLWTLPGFASCQADAINRSGVVAGAATAPNGEQHACIWRHGRMIDLGALAGGHGSSALGINSQEDVVGSSSTATRSGMGPVTHAFLWRSGRMMDLGAVGGWPQSYATAINDHGLVVGSLERPAATGIGNQTHAFVWQRNRMRDLNELIRRNSGWVLSEAVDINDQDQIVGNGIYKGRHRPFLLTPSRGTWAWLLVARAAAKSIHEPSSAGARTRMSKIRVALLPTFISRRPRTAVVEKIGAYRAILIEPSPRIEDRHPHLANAAAKPQMHRRETLIPIGYEGVVVARGSRPDTYQVQNGNLSRDIYLGPGKLAKPGDEIRVRGVLQRNGVVAVSSISRLGYHHHDVRVTSTSMKP